MYEARLRVTRAIAAACDGTIVALSPPQNIEVRRLVPESYCKCGRFGTLGIRQKTEVAGIIKFKKKKEKNGVHFVHIEQGSF